VWFGWDRLSDPNNVEPNPGVPAWLVCSANGLIACIEGASIGAPIGVALLQMSVAVAPLPRPHLHFLGELLLGLPQLLALLAVSWLGAGFFRWLWK
jgi:hypothetical protein